MCVVGDVHGAVNVAVVGGQEGGIHRVLELHFQLRLEKPFSTMKSNSPNTAKATSTGAASTPKSLQG